MSDSTEAIGAGQTLPAPKPELGAALDAFKNAAAGSSGYRDWLAVRGVDPASVTSIHEVPYLVKQDVFGGDVNPWLVGGRLSAAAELVTSSGRGGMFSIGVSSEAERRRLPGTIDEALRAVGASENSATLLMNCLAMGINLPTSLATVATPSVHVEMAQEMFERLGPNFDRVAVVGEPVFLKEFAERVSDTARSRQPGTMSCFVGGEWVAESWRTYVGGLMGMGRAEDSMDPGIFISMGAAEVGLNLLYETVELRSLRAVLHTTDQGDRLVKRAFGYTPTLFSYDRDRLYVEERLHDDGSTTLAFTHLEERMLPLVRYDLGDMAELVPAARVNAVCAEAGLPIAVDHPIVAFWGRRGDELTIGGGTVRPEQIKQRLFAVASDAAVLTGRFFVAQASPTPTLHLQLRQGAVAHDRLAVDVMAFVNAVTGVTCDLHVHAYDRYPYHASGDYQHKPIYHGGR